MNKEDIKEKLQYWQKSQIVINICIAVLLNIIIELFARKSFYEVFLYVKDRPLVFLFNTALILLSLCAVFLMRRRVFGVLVIAALWLAIGITNGVMLGYRVTPFTVVDLVLIKSALAIMNKYLSVVQQIALWVGLFSCLVLFVLTFLFGPKYEKRLQFKRNSAALLIACMCFLVLTKVALRTGVVSRYFGNIAYAYQEYGVPYCFTVTFVDRGIRKPAGYTQEKVRNAATKTFRDAKSPIAIRKGTIVQKPNLIFVQLESFFDPKLVKGLQFSRDPVPYFTQLRKKYSSGYLKVPVVGAGTCNTEFEVITGMDMDFFGPGEYPYKSILTKTTCESIAYDLKKLGYTAHAIHNNNGNFYGRNKVFSKLGFDTFTSIEYMKNVEMNPIGWAKDHVLTEEIFKCLTATKGPDVIYTVSVQGHGNYPSTPQENEAGITIRGLEEGGHKNAFTYYVNQISEMDDFIRELVEKLSNWKEKTIVVFYGDHLPGLGLEKNQLKYKNIYETQYVIWNNFGLPKKDMNIEAFQLSATVLSRVGLHPGTLIGYHQRNMGSSKYKKYLQMLQYDMLYGKRYVYQEQNPYVATELKMGIEDITIRSVEQLGDMVQVKGNNFTSYSYVYVNDHLADTTYVDEHTLEVKGISLENGAKISVRQRGKRQHVISATPDYIYEQ